MEHDYLLELKRSHPALRLLAADTAPLILGFLYKVFVQPNRRGIGQDELESQLDDYLFGLHRIYGDDMYPRSGAQYLEGWAEPGRGILRKYYPDRGDEPEYDLTPSTARALDWIQSLAERQFVGTESRLRIIIKQLRRFLDDQAWLENHRIMELIKAIEKKTITIKDDVPSEKNFSSANQVKPILELPMSRSLFTPPCGVRLDEITVEDGSSDITADLLYEQIYVDKELLLQRIRRMLQPRIQISLSEVINRMIGYVRDNDLDYAKHAVNNALKKNVPQLGLHKPEQLNPSRLLPEESRCVETRHHISNHFFTIFHFFLAYDLSTLSK